ncbi:MAG: cysteine synthase family protein [Holophaga sp.]|nr:cysteine synthase family protein [Holophaga sp.]
MHDKRCYDSILEVIGNTPMVRLNRITADLPCRVFAKLEFLNPMGSSKDRIAKHLIECAERDGRIQPGDLILENSSGNTAMGLALTAIQKGYRIKAVVRDHTSKEKLDLLSALGVDVVKADTSLPPEDPDSYNNITPRLARDTPHCYFPDQHNNRENNEAHYRSTGPEVWEQMDGRIDVFIAGMGTGGTIGGVGRYLKEQNPKVRIVAVDVEGSVFTQFFRSGQAGASRPYLLEGLGDEFIIGCAEFEVIDEMVQVSDREAFLGARELARREGILVGGSSGAVLAALRRIAPTLAPDARVAVLFPDSASRYLSTIFNDDWMREKGMLEP